MMSEIWEMVWQLAVAIAAGLTATACLLLAVGLILWAIGFVTPSGVTGLGPTAKARATETATADHR